MAAEDVWLVQGSTGEYSDHTEWVVCAYTNEEQACEHVLLAQEWCNEHHTERYTDVGKQNTYDHSCQIDYTGTRYCATKVMLVRHVDEYMDFRPV